MDNKVSIIVPCYKQAEYLPETIDSVIAQTYTNWECVIINDGSPDNTEAVAKKYCDADKRIKYIYQPNAGISAARNYGIANSNGDFILPLDSDDKIASDYLSQAVDYFTKNPSCKVVYCKARKFGWRNYEWDLGEYSYDTLLWRNCIFCSAIFKREDFLLTNGYNVNMRHGWEDWDFWLSLLKRGDEVHQLDSVMFFYRIKKLSRNVSANDYHTELYKQVYANHPDLYSDIRGRELELLAKNHFLEQDIVDIRNSNSYKIGFRLTETFRSIKKIFRLSD